MNFILSCTGNTIPTIVFNAKSVTSNSPQTGQPVVFSSVLSNIGSGYSSTTGKFTAPVNGTYIFTVQLCVTTNKAAEFGFIVDGTVSTAFQDKDHDEYSTASTSIQLFLKQGQKVWVRPVNPCLSCLINSGTCWNRFSGSLVH